MKVLIILLAILAGVWFWRSRRQKSLTERQRPTVEPPPADAGTAPMVACAVCGVHVPPTEVITGRLGSYCSVAHRQRAEG